MTDRVPVELAVIDLAGTVVSDPGVVEAAVRRVTGASFDEAVFRRHRGGSKLDMLDALVGTEAAPGALAEFESQVLAAIQSGAVEALPHADDGLARISAADIRICLTTGFSSVVRRSLVTSLGWDDVVDLSLSPDAGCRGRPHPDLVLTAARRLAITDTARVAVVGDTANDVLAARRAGAGVAAAVSTGAHDRARLTDAGPTHLLDHIGDFADLVTGLTAATPAATDP